MKFKLDQNKIEEALRHRYWSRETGDRTWFPMPDTQEAKEQAIRHGAMFFSYPMFDRLPEEGQPEPMRYGPMVLDFDSKTDPAKAFREARQLITHLSDYYSLDANALDLFASGGKGCHVEIPPECFGAQDGDPLLPLVYKRFASEWKADLGLETIDMSLYCMGMGKMIRAENVLRENGRYKIPLTLDEFLHLSIDELTQLTMAPRTIEPPDGAEYECPDLAADFREKRDQIHREQAETKDAPPPDPEIMGRLSGRIAPCVCHIIAGKPKTERTTFNKLCMVLASYFQGAGFTLDKALEVLGRFISEYPHSTSYTTAEARHKHFLAIWAYTQGNESYHFRCSLVLGMGFPGSAFECRECPMRAEQQQPETEPSSKFLPLTPDQTRVRDFLFTEPPPPEFVINCRGNGFIRKGIVALLISMGGLGKTFLLIRLALMAAAGSRWGCFEAVKPLRVLYLGAEDDQEELNRRLWVSADGDFPENLHAVSVTGKIGPLLKLDNQNPTPSDWYDWLHETVRLHVLDILIVDPLSRVFGLKENSNEDATAFITLMEKISIEFGITIMIAHHANKESYINGKAKQSMARGASAFIDGCRMAIGLNNVFEDDVSRYGIENPEQCFKLFSMKSNGSAMLSAPVFFRKDPASGVPDQISVRDENTESMAADFVAALADHPKGITERQMGRGEPEDFFSRFGNLEAVAIRKNHRAILSYCLENNMITESYREHKGQIFKKYRVKI